VVVGPEFGEDGIGTTGITNEVEEEEREEIGPVLDSLGLGQIFIIIIKNRLLIIFLAKKSLLYMYSINLFMTSIKCFSV